MGSRLVAAIVLLGLLLGTLAASPARAATSAVAVNGTEEMLGVACPASTFCLGVGDDFSTSPPGYVVAPLAIKGASLDVGPIMTPAAPFDLVLRGIACPTRSLCLAVGSGGQATQGVVLPLQLSGERVSPEPIQTVAAGPTQTDLNRVACPTPTTCVAVGSSFTRDGSPGSSVGVAAVLMVRGSRVDVGAVEPVPVTATLSDVACPTSARCLATGSIADGIVPAPTGAVVSLDVRGSGLDVGPIQSVAGSDHLYALSCSGPTICLAVGDGDTQSVAVPLAVGASVATPGTVRNVAGAAGAQGIVCPASDRCFVAGGNSAQGVISALALSEGQISGETSQVVAGVSVLDGVACPADNRCIVVGSDAAADPGAGQGAVALVSGT